MDVGGQSDGCLLAASSVSRDRGKGVTLILGRVYSRFWLKELNRCISLNSLIGPHLRFVINLSPPPLHHPFSTDPLRHQAMPSPVIQDWLKRVLVPYPSAADLAREVGQALDRFPTLQVRTEAYSESCVMVVQRGYGASRWALKGSWWLC